MIDLLRFFQKKSFVLSSDPQRVTLLGKDSDSMVNLLETQRVIVSFF